MDTFILTLQLFTSIPINKSVEVSDEVAFLFGSMSVLSRIIYAVIGICGLYAISFCGRINN